MTDSLTCPLCAAAHCTHYHRDARRDYLLCPRCALIFVPPAFHLEPEEERAVYDQHQNSPEDAGYRRFLSRLFTPLVGELEPGARGLDFGSGPGPTLSVMFEEAGHPMAIYDPYYAPDTAVLRGQYDFITATEVVEHLAAPGRELARLVALLRPGGWLGLMTKRPTGHAAFGDWHYILDPTHIGFYSEATLSWFASAHGLAVRFPAADVALLQKGR